MLLWLDDFQVSHVSQYKMEYIFSLLRRDQYACIKKQRFVMRIYNSYSIRWTVIHLCLWNVFILEREPLCQCGSFLGREKMEWKETGSVNTIIINYQSITSKQSPDALKHAHLGTSHNSLQLLQSIKLEDEGQKTAEEKVNTIWR